MSGEANLLLKVCGMRDEENIRAVAALKPDYMGFIFYDKSPRYVGSNFTLPGGFPKEVRRVGVFVNAPAEEMLRQVERCELDYLQLHGDETVEQVADLRKSGVGIFKVFSVDSAFDFAALAPYAAHVDYFLFDTKGQYYGGNAKRFDWSLLNRYNQSVPFLLSGGLTVENAMEVRNLRGMNLHALDINSGVETAPGIKDLSRVKQVKELIQKRNDSL